MSEILAKQISVTQRQLSNFSFRVARAVVGGHHLVKHFGLHSASAGLMMALALLLLWDDTIV